MADGISNGGSTKTRGSYARLLLAAILLTITWGLAATHTPPPPDLSAYPWIYLREGRAPGDGEATISLLAVGDVMPGRGVAVATNPLRQAAPWLRAADLALGNLEAVLAPESAPRAGEGRILLAAPPVATGWLRAAGFDLLGLANNHSLDYGPQGLAGTAKRLQAAGITPLGAGRAEGAYEPVVKEIRGVRLAFLAFNAVPDPGPAVAHGDRQPAQWDEARAVATVAAARRQAHAVIVSLHWGQEYALRAAPWQRAAARALAQAGADLVLGHHPHVVQEWAILEARNDGALAAYSLGNFLFDQEGPHMDQGLALHALFDRRGLRAAQALPVRAGLQPRLMDPQEAQPLLARIAPPAPRLTFACEAHHCAEVDNTRLPDGGETEGLFWSGAIDLTGDGELEVVRREAERVRIYEQGVVAWESPPEWRVVDVALGDPNDDGRGELLLAFWREDAQGHARSQPFIVGHRGGEYKVLWGGRAVAAPILEVALGDVDGDGAQELVVLEVAGEGQQARGEPARLALFRGQGWTFSLVWRSEPGDYADLRLAPGADGAWLITVALAGS